MKVSWIVPQNKKHLRMEVAPLSVWSCNISSFIIVSQVFCSAMLCLPSISLKEMNSFLARLFSKKTTRYCHSPGGGVQKLSHFIISLITGDIYLKLRIVVHYQKGNSYK